MPSKLTLSVNAEVVRRAKRFARQHRTSISAIVETFLNSVADSAPSPDEPQGPVLREMQGLLRSGARNEYQGYLAEKYR